MDEAYHRLLEIIQTHCQFCNLWIEKKITDDEMMMGIRHFNDAIDNEFLKQKGL